MSEQNHVESQLEDTDTVRKKQMPAVGLDLCGVERMEELVNDERFLQRYFTDQEIAYIQTRGLHAAETMAGILSAKEAFSKAIGTGIVFPLKDVEVVHDENGAPAYVLSGKAKTFAGNRQCSLSISHDAGVAGAVCILF